MKHITLILEPAFLWSFERKTMTLVGEMLEKKERLKQHISPNRYIKKDISFIISSRNQLRESRLAEIVTHLRKSIFDYTYEVLIYAPHVQPREENVTFVNQNINDEGSAYGYNLCASKSTGEYICILTDYSVHHTQYRLFAYVFKKRKNFICYVFCLQSR